MHHSLRTLAAIGTLGCATMVLIPLGCGSRLGPVHATQKGGLDHPNLPDITVERAKECVAEYGAQLDSGHHTFNSKVVVNDDGDKEDVTIDDIPGTAPDFAACMRNVLRDMPIAEQPFRQGLKELKYRREHPSADQRQFMGSPVIIVIAGVTIVVTELVLEAGATTILFAVTVEVIDKAIRDMRRRPRWKRNCDEKLAECLLSSLGRLWGNVKGSSRCVMCYDRCDEDGWPLGIQIDDDVFATCQYH